MRPIDGYQRLSEALLGALSCILLVACSATGEGAWKVPQDERDEWGLAREASNAERWEEAAGRWNEIFMRHGTDWEVACAETARALCRLRDPSSAQGVLAIGLRLSPGDPRLLEVNGEVLAGRGFRRAAEKCYLQALEADPDRPSALLALGRLRLELGLEQSAREPLRRRIALGHADAETCWLLAEATRRSGDPVAALGSYQRAFEFGDQPAHILVSAASLYLDERVRGSCPEARLLAMRWLRDAVSKDPQNTEAHFYLALVLLDGDREDEALRRLRRAVETDPTHVPSLTRLAELHMDRGELDGARDMANRALALVGDGSEKEALEELLAVAAAPEPQSSR